MNSKRKLSPPDFKESSEFLLQNEDIVEETSAMAFDAGPRHKKIHKDASQCFEFASSVEGSQALTNPALVSKSSRDPNRNLLPRLPSMGGFQKASGILKPDTIYFQNSEARSSQSPTKNVFPSAKSNRRQTGMGKIGQNNVINNYFSKKESGSSVSSQEKPQSSVKMYSPIKETSPGSHIYVPDKDRLREQSRSNFAFEKSKSNPQKSNQLLDGYRNSKQSSSEGKRKSKKKPEPQFNRQNTFLYSTCTPGVTKVNVSSACTPKNSVHISDDEDEEAINHFDRLPEEVLANIFCRLPMLNLALNVSTVCHSWNDIINDPEFVPWKKTYHKLLKGDQEAKSSLSEVMHKHEMHKIEDYLPGLIRYIATYKPLTGKAIISSLEKHNLYAAANDLLHERFPDCVKQDVPKGWSVVATLILLSENVNDILEIITVLTSGDSVCTALDLLECFYCINSFLFVFKELRYQDVWTRMHYRLYYALYLYENEHQSTCGELRSTFNNKRGQQSLLRYSSSDTSVRLTHEQLRICNHDIEPAQTIKIIAFAGTGKTTTLVRYTQFRPNQKFLLIVYNKSVSEHAKTKFPSNVTVMTGHALGFKHVGRKYAACKKLGNLKVNDIVQNIKARKGESLFVQAKFVQDTLNNFMSSDHDFITTAHVPDQRTEADGKQHFVDHETKMNLAKDAEKLWEMMVDVNNTRMKMPHDGYLKLYQLKKWKIYGHDVLMIDEAQDLTPCITDILLKQQQPKILVGDPHQQIYSFRGAVNAMEQVQESHIFYLTQSFRFGPEISFVASTFLEFFKNEKKRILVGNGYSGSTSGDTVGQVAIICRSNSTLFAEAVKRCCYSNENIKVAFAGGKDAFGFDMLLDIYTLLLPPEDRRKEGRVIKHPLVKVFHSFDELCKFATKTTDNELLGKIRIVKTYHNALPSLISKILSKTLNSMDNADIVFSTAHKAKGLEFSTVRLTDDYITGPGNLTANFVQQLPKDEINLLYVAVTRAKHRLVLSPTLLRLLEFAGETMCQAVHSKCLISPEKATLSCISTQREFKPQSVTLVKKKIKLSNGSKVDGGPYCPQIVSEEMSSLKHIFGALKDERDDPNYIPPLDNHGELNLLDNDIIFG